MKSANYYLKIILGKLGGNTVGVKNNNQYLKEISEKIDGGGSGGNDTLDIVITYTDGTSETVSFIVEGE